MLVLLQLASSELQIAGEGKPMWLFLSPSIYTVPGPWWGRAPVPDRALMSCWVWN